MRKFFLFVLLVSLMLVPSIVQAQGDIKIAELNIQLWPEYDHPDMLVMYSFNLTEDTAFPAEFTLRVPANANLNAIAKVEGDSMVNVPYDAPVASGDWVSITMVIDDLSNYRVEYYLPLEKKGATRNFSFLWQSDYAVETLYVQFQQPPSSSNFLSTPTFPSINPASGGINYHELSLTNLAADAPFALELSYEKENDDLTVSSMPVEMGNTPTESGFSFSDSLPTILVGIGVVLIIGGLVYFFLAGRRSEEQKEGRKRHAPSAASAGGNVYCPECGSRAHAGDKFCRSCGVKLRI